MDEQRSSLWYRVANTVPRLRAQAQVFRHVYRGAPWFLVQDLGSGRFLRLNATAYRVVALIDGLRCLDEIWQHLNDALGDEAPSQDEIISLVAQLYQANVLVADRMPDLAELEERRQRTWRQRLKQYFANPMALRFPLFDPDRFLCVLIEILPRPLWRWVLLAWFGLIGFGVLLAVQHWEALTHDLGRLVFTPEYIISLFFVFPVLKALHEIGHGLAIKAFGGQCHEMGLMLLVLMPIPYVDASHATGFNRKSQRMLVSAGGMIFELGLASIALYAWTIAEPGLARVMLHEVVLIAGISTLLFNINPLIKLDGYYILSDLLEIPNLGQRSNEYFGYCLKRYVLRLHRHLSVPHQVKGEAPWLFFYSIASFIYRMLLVVFISLFVAGQLFFLGVLLAIWAIYMMVVLPFGKSLSKAWNDPALLDYRGRLVRSLVLGTVAIAAVVMLVPLPSTTSTQGIVWTPQGAQITAPADCFGVQRYAMPGPVDSGVPLIQCDDPMLAGELDVLQAREARFLAELRRANVTDPVSAQSLQDELDYLAAAIADRQRRVDGFMVRAPRDGVFVPRQEGDVEGRFFRRGELLGHIVDPRDISVLAVINQPDAERVSRVGTQVSLRATSRIQEPLPATIIRQVPSASDTLPHFALSIQGGGRIGLDPQAPPEASLRTLEPVFLVEVAPEADGFDWLGERVYLLFRHPPEPLGVQLYRGLRDLFMQRFMI